MNSSFLPGCTNMYASKALRFAAFCHSSPGILVISEPLPCTTSSCDRGNTKFSFQAYNIEKVRC